MSFDISLPIHEDLDGYKETIFLNSESELRYRRSLEQMAIYFRKEFRFDRLQYQAKEQEVDCIGVLFLSSALDLVQHESHYPNRVVGGSCFWQKDSGEFFLDWVWFHPFARNRGNLKKRWPELKRQFGDFEVTKPLSPHMKMFLDKY